MKLMIILDSFCCLIMPDKMGSKKERLPDRVLIAMLQSGDPQQEKDAMDNLMEHDIPGIQKMLKSRNAEEKDAEDFSMLALGLLLLEGRKGRASRIDDLGAWLAGTAKNKWLNELRRRKDFGEIAEELVQNPPSNSRFDAEKAMEVINIVLDRIGECKQILIWRFLDGFGLTDIASRVGLVALEAVARRIEDCLRKAREAGDDLDFEFT